MRDYEAVTVATGDGRWALELVPEFGGLLNRLTCNSAGPDSVELIAGLPTRQALQQNHYFRGVPLYPYVNRLEDGTYEHQGQRYGFPVNEPATHNSLHGFLFQLRPEVKDVVVQEHAAEVTLVYHYQGDISGYPFPARISLRYQLQRERGLTLTFSVVNLHHASVPLGIGWHPYLSLGCKVNDLQLRMPPVHRIAVDERQLPTGIQTPYSRFATLTALGAVQLDDCFAIQSETDQAEPSREVGFLLWSPARRCGVELWQQQNCYPFVHVFIPPDRQSVALEPVSCGINAFNTGEGLRELASGESFIAKCGLRMVTTLNAD